MSTADRTSHGRGGEPDLRSSPAQALGQSRRRISHSTRFARDRVLLLFTIPGVLVLLMFQYVPLLGNLIAFKDYQPFLGFYHSAWSGWDNFKVIFNGDSDFLNALKNTLVITAIQLVFVFPAPILLALLMNSLMSERLGRLVQNILYLPHFMSWVVVVAIFQQMLGGSGLISTWLQHGGHEGLNLIGNPGAFPWLVALQVMWRDTGWGTIMFLAALSQIDEHLYEASAVDGAGAWQQLWHVTLPGIRPTIILLFILRLGDVLTVGFEQIVLQQSAVGLNASEVLDTYVYNNGILGGDWGTSAAVGLVKGVISVLLVLAANKVAHWFGEDGIYQS